MAKAVGGNPRIAGGLGEDEGALQHALDVEGEAGGGPSGPLAPPGEDGGDVGLQR